MAKYSFELKKQIVLDTIAVRDGSKGKPGVYTGDAITFRALVLLGIPAILVLLLIFEM